MKKQIKITDINPQAKSFSVPAGYFDSLNEKLQSKIQDEQPLVNLEQLNKSLDTFEVPEGYFETLGSAILENAKKTEPDNIVSFRTRRIKIWGSMVAAACIAMIIISIFQFSNPTPDQPEIYVDNSIIKRIPDHEIAALLQDRDDEFELTEDEILEVIEHESAESETSAIINFLEEDADISGTYQEDFIESI